MEPKDTLYSDYRERVADFVFDDAVAAVFDDMIRRSVPGYATVIAMTKVFAEQYAAQAGSVCYDLGCSLGASALAMRKGIICPGCRIIAVDNSAQMVKRCTEIVALDKGIVPVEVFQADIRDVPIKKASVVVMNFTLQFLSPDQRDAMIQKIYDGLRPGGVLLLSEKITFEDADKQAFETDMHHEFKKLMGYSDLEVAQKRKSLEKVLLPETLEAHKNRLKKSGFAKTHLWFQCFNFMSLAAFKESTTAERRKPPG
ncbi:MAG: carboxy-S-adenosyl-L-methionine synthase CmoA [Planctomycetales bacterium 4572_13]|nr:MAG: carboxy-S-adenosyl-L-methionine synthase CmoA [Planctomycetales bacterium 4572_13]